MSAYEIVGPFDGQCVVVEGRRVPFLEAFPMNGGKIHLLLDGRFGLEVSVSDAEQLIPWVADAIAIGLGYTCHPRTGMDPLRANPFPLMHAIGPEVKS